MRVLSKHWEPSKYDEGTIKDEFKFHFSCAAVTVMCPLLARTVVVGKARGTEWHQDQYSSSNRTAVKGNLILWSNENPTEIRKIGSSEITIPEPFSVVRFDNRLYEHRASLIMPKDRWFVRGVDKF